MQIYIAALIEAAGVTPVGKTWMLDRTKVMLDLGITDIEFDELQQRIEQQMPGKWQRATTCDCKMYLYMRVA